MKVAKTRLTNDEKIAWHQFCQANHVSESEMLRMMIQKVSGSTSDAGADVNHEPKSDKITVRLASENFKKVGVKAREEGFLNKTNWTTSAVLAALHRQPVLTNDEINILRRSCRELNAIGRNLNQVARALNVESSEEKRIKHEAIAALAKHIDEHCASVSELLNKNMNRWG
ncbi:plasmid mobilization relaxosome protein MobC [Kushneria konosiri]|uniref:Uncharacterized protein n=1 Tax=Kushneria konosiri TaxID=698828 RepID=A0A2Z2H7T6_9GAMM|nr:plasmid mobilization relaxosome protein MobC [Kushneria konosiri]ARS53523.1 hypothetical protein B9G99_12195 [Kushneria konosiri]